MAKRSHLFLRFVACFIVVATAAVYTTTSAMAQVYCANPLYLDVSGVDVDLCGSEEAPCADFEYVAERALSCSLELGEEISIIQFVEDGDIAVGLANASGLADAPAIVGITDPAESDSAGDDAVGEAEEPAVAADAEVVSEEGAAEESATVEIEAGEESTTNANPWAASRDNALYSILALLLGAVLGVVIGYGSRSGASTAAVVAVLIAAGVALAPTAAYAQEQCPGEYAFFSEETGMDVDACGDAEQPCQTFEYALGQASACLHGVTIYEGETPIFMLELSSGLSKVGDETISEIGESAVNIEVADEVDAEGAVEETAEEAAVDVAEAVEEVSEATGELVDIAETPVAADLDWIWLIGMIALGAVLGYAAHALPSAKIE